MPRVSSLVAALPLLLCTAGTAFAHAHLKTAEPAVDGTVSTPPGQVAITFTEGVEPAFSTIEVDDAKGQRVDKADPHTAPADAKRLIVDLAALTPGVYTVTWHATAVDTHKTEGIFHFTVASMAASMGAMPGMAAEAPAGAAIVASEAWARATPPNGRTAAAYLTLTDNGPPDHVVGASTPVAGSASVHETTNDNGVMKMRAVPSLPLDTGKPVAFAPGGYHVMLMDLKHPLKAGDHFPLTLTFEHAPKLTVEVAVQAMGAAPPMAMSMPMGGMNMGGASK